MPQEEVIVPDAIRDHLETYTASEPWLKHREEYFLAREITEQEYLREVVEAVEHITGPLTDWQRFYIAATVSGRGVEWAQTRARPHYHIVGLPCSICGRS